MKQKRNSIMRGISGALGDELVFRQRGGKTIVCMPSVTRPDNPTDKQTGVRTRFQQAVRFAKTILANPSLKEEYQRKSTANVSAYNLAFADFFKAPEIIHVDLAEYTGAIGDTISILATGNFKVQLVSVSILDDAGNLLEEGPAVMNPEDPEIWVYTATVENLPEEELTVKVRASDLPGNITEQDVIVTV